MKRIIVKNETGSTLKVLVVERHTKYQEQIPRVRIPNKTKKEIIIADNFSRLVLSKY